MIIATKKETFRILKEHNLIAKKGYGQNFLINPEIIKNIVEKTNITKETLVIEIGPGLGALTQQLLQVSSKVIAIEIDKKMVEVLNENLECESLEIINEDFLKIDLNQLIKENSEYKEVIVVSNLPYYITSDILENIISLRNNKITKIVAMMQKEVGKKLVKKEENIESYLKVLIDNYCDTKILLYVSKNDFEPRPKVDSIVLEFDINKDMYKLDSNQLKLIKDCLSNRRKTLLNTLPYDKQNIINTLNKLKLKETLRIEETKIKQIQEIINDLEQK